MQTEPIQRAGRLSTKQVMAQTGKSRGAIWRLVKEGYFPPPVRRGPKGGRIYWIEADVAAWIARQ